MDYASYLRVLLSVWVSLGLAQLVRATHGLARAKGMVKWDWLPVSWAALAFLMFVQTWWAYFALLEAPLWTNLFAFLLPLAVFVILYLICDSALPDVGKSSDGETVDLTTYYFSQHRYFFGLWAALLVLALLVSALVRGLEGLRADVFRISALAAAIALSLSSARPLHVAVTVAAFLALAIYIVLFSLRLT